MLYAVQSWIGLDAVCRKLTICVGAVVAFTPRQGITTWGDWDEAANGFYDFFLERAIGQKDGFAFIFELLADGVEGTIGFGTVTGRKAVA